MRTEEGFDFSPDLLVGCSAQVDNVAGRAERVRALLDAGVEARIYDLE
jgi:hypothetical protein